MADIEQLLAALDHEVETGAVSLVDYWRRRASIEAGHGDPRRSQPPVTAPPVTPPPVPARPPVQPTPPPVTAPTQPPPVRPVAPPPPVTPTQVQPGTAPVHPGAAPVQLGAPPLPAPMSPPPAEEIAWRELGESLHGIPGERVSHPLADGPVRPAPGLTPIPRPSPPDLPMAPPAPADAPAAAEPGRPAGPHPFAPSEGAVQLPVHTSWDPEQPSTPPRWLARLSDKGDTSVRKGSGRRRGWGRRGR